MVKTHSYSRFALKSLDQIRDTSDVILQVEKTESTFKDSNQAVYLCEIVALHQYDKQGTKEALAEELIRANIENRRLLKKIERLQAKV
ncbi:MAG: hypothetical protein WC374_04755 [Phycisphaerae bacterium]|jgi:hypothetical protein